MSENVNFHHDVRYKMRLAIRSILLLGAVFVQYICFLLFAKGFFPQKALLSGLNSFEGVVKQADILAQVPQDNPKFDKLIFILIDALRSDFVFSSNSSMRNLHHLLNSNEAIGFTAFANPPTVTLPRLKALTTGSISNFLDAILNIHESDTSSTLEIQDSWLRQFLDTKNRSMNFFGDDTWLKLFPNSFNESEGTTSFFVSDFTEVDNNVTRHIDSQLENDVWDGLILHYLGLDHIGHKSGPNSIYMPQKQQELDEIIFGIYQDYVVPKHELGQNTLMVIVGDHGMNEIGNHGGSSISETSSAMVFLSPVLGENAAVNKEPVPITVNDDFQFLSQINQIDLIPTLCHFFNLPIPKNNLGILIDKFVDVSPGGPVKVIENGYQFKTLIEVKFGRTMRKAYDPLATFEDSEFGKFDKLWHNSVLKYQAEPQDTPLSSVYEYLRETQDFLQASSTTYQVTDLFYSIIGLSVSVCIVFGLYYHLIRALELELVGVFYVISVIIFGVTTFASSLVEEEHQVWWAFSTVYLVFLASILYKRYGNSVLVALVLCLLVFFRIIRYWNTSGQKYNFLDEYTQHKIAYHLTVNQNIGLWILIATLLLYSQILTNGGLNVAHKSIAFVFPFTLTLLIVSFKVNFEHANTGGEKFNSVFKAVVTKSSEMFVKYDSKQLLIVLAQLSFKLWAGLVVIRFVILKVNYLWFNTEITTEKSEYVKVEDSTATIVKKKLSGKVQFKKVVKVSRQYIDGHYDYLNDIANLITMVLILQSKTENVGLYIVFFAIKFLGTKLINKIVELELATQSLDSLLAGGLHLRITVLATIAGLILQNLSFYQFGFTNSISTVDLALAYNGTASFNIGFVGLLTFVSNFSSPIYWAFHSLVWIYDNRLVNNEDRRLVFRQVKYEIFYARYLTLTLFYGTFGLFLLVACFNLRFHLFIWTVFSPKLLFFGAWSFLVNGLVELVAFVLIAAY